jgi:hypothetical protein
MEIFSFIFKALTGSLIELAISLLIAGDYFSGKKGLIVDVLAAICMLGLSWLLTYTGRAREYICKSSEVPQSVEGLSFDTKSCLADTQWLLAWGESFKTSLSMHPVVAAIVLFFMVKWGWLLIKKHIS